MGIIKREGVLLIMNSFVIRFVIVSLVTNIFVAPFLGDLVGLKWLFISGLTVYWEWATRLPEDKKKARG